MNHNSLLGLRRAVWRLRRVVASRISPTLSEDPTLNVMSARRLTRSEDRTDSSVDVTGLATTGSAGYETAQVRARALGLWSSGNWEGALRLLRSGLRDNPKDSLLWMSLGQRLQEFGSVDGAFLAYTNAVELDAGNFAALEPFIAIAESRGDSTMIESVLAGLPRAIKGRPHRFLESLDYSIPYALDEALRVVELEGDGLAKAVVECVRGSARDSSGESEGRVSAAELRAAINQDDVQEVLSILPSLPQNEIPADSLRRSIRRIRSWPEYDPKSFGDLITEYMRARPNEFWISRWKPEEEKCEEDGALMLSGYHLTPVSPSLAQAPPTDRIAYILYNSLPYHSAGYSTRTHGLLRALRDQKWDMFGVTRLGYPHDMPGWSNVGELARSENIDGISYHRLSPKPEVVPKRPVKPYLDQYAHRLVERLRQEKPSIVHAASNHLNGLAAITAARILGIPSVYEVRGLWEVTRGSRDPVWANGPEYRLTVQMETEAAKNATHVVAITEALKEELIYRGVAETKITVVPNGVDSSRFRPRPRDQDLAEKLGLTDCTVIGYIGSIVDYEGLGLLVEAVANLANERNDFAVLIVGDGADVDRLKRLVKLTGTDKIIKFVGRVPHDEAERYYTLIDIAPFPRLPLPVCEMVSPLKPFEAMSMEKIVVASNVAALAEIVSDKVTGLLFDKGDVSSLTDCLRLLLDDPSLRRKLAGDSRAWVEAERRWDLLASKLGEVYESLGAQRQTRSSVQRKV